MIDWFMSMFQVETRFELAWIGLGFLAQFMFMMRFVVQWIASERARRSILPVAFWYFSTAGGTLLLAYAIHREDPVFILGQSLGLFIYLRNLVFIRRERNDQRARERYEA